MEFLILLALIVTVGVLWTRSTSAEMRLRHMEARLAGLEAALPSERDGIAAPVAPRLEPRASWQPPRAGRASTDRISDRETENSIEGLRRTQPEVTRPSDPKLGSQPDSEPALKPAREPARRPEPSSEPTGKSISASKPKVAFQPEKNVALLEDDSRTTPTGSFDFEDMFGRLLPIWAGGITLAVAGFFLVKYSIDMGLLGPKVRVALGFLFGGGLLAGAEIAYRAEARIADDRVRQALAGAGLATLYASFYLAGSLYDLVGSTIAFLGLAGVTGAAILLSFRFGLPAAILGLVGGFAAPLLVGSDGANVPLLALYLSLVTGGLTYAGNRQGRSWLALAALAGGLGWGALILLSGLFGSADILAFGGYIVVIGAVLPALTPGRDAAQGWRMVAGGLAALQLAIMVQQTGFGLLAWGLYILLGGAITFFAWGDARLRTASAFGAALSAAMLALWPVSNWLDFAIVGAALLAIFAGIPLANIWRRATTRADIGQVAGFSLAMIAATCLHFYGTGGNYTVAAACLLIALLPVAGAWRNWPAPDVPVGTDGIVPAASAAIAATIAGLVVAPLWAVPLVWSAVSLAIVALSWHRKDDMLAVMLVTWLAVLAASLLTGPYGSGELARLAGLQWGSDPVQAVIRWIAALLPFVVLTQRRIVPAITRLAEIGAGVLSYGLAAQIVPAPWLVWFLAAGAAVLTHVSAGRFAARYTVLAITLCWIVQPVLFWLDRAVRAAGGDPMLIAQTLDMRAIGLQLLPALVVSGTLLVRPVGLAAIHRRWAAILAAGIGTIAIHGGFKHVFAIIARDEFSALGMAERTLWQALLLAGALAVWRGLRGHAFAPIVSGGLAVAAFAHFAVFTLAWHNPLWTAQAVGSWPWINLLVPAYAIALMAIWWAGRMEPVRKNVPQWLLDIAAMMTVGMFALSQLRQSFAGSVLTSQPLGQGEDLLRSLLGIMLAVGFLWWGSHKNRRSWRIGSLVLMLGAVCKVFVFDANGLEGLVRIASFVALGFSLIGIGWFYARQLQSQDSGPEQA